MEQLDKEPHQDRLRHSLAQCKLFTSLSAAQIDEVAKHGELLQFSQGEGIAKQGEQADGFFIIISGETAVEMVTSETEHTVVLTRLSSGEFFGEMATLLGSKRNANVVTVSPFCSVLRYSGEQFKNMLRNLPYFSAAMAHSLAVRLQKTSVKTSTQGAEGVDEVEADVLRLVPEAFCVRHRVLPIAVTDGALRIGFVDQPTREVLAKLQTFAPSLRLEVQSLNLHEFDQLFRNLVWPRLDSVRVDSDPGFSLSGLLMRCIGEGASDVHLTTGLAPRWRIDGALLPIRGYAPLSADQLNAIVHEILPSGTQWQANDKDLDFAYEFEGGERFRVNVFRDMNGAAIALRHIPSRILTLAQLDAPRALTDVCRRPKGLFLVTGPTGSGKSTTLAAMINHINLTQTKHIITLEDPIEYRHVSAKALVNQREIGVHAATFSSALRSALREDPDVVLVGEMRDLETISLAIEIAQTGHLVFATLHTTSAIGTIERIVGMFDNEKQAQIRDSLSDVLVGVVSQTLLKRIGGGRVAAYEVMMNSPAIAHLIREMKTTQIATYFGAGQKQGNRSMEADLSRLVSTGKVSLDEARTKSTSPEKVTSGR